MIYHAANANQHMKNLKELLQTTQFKQMLSRNLVKIHASVAYCDHSLDQCGNLLDKHQMRR